MLHLPFRCSFPCIAIWNAAPALACNKFLAMSSFWLYIIFLICWHCVLCISQYFTKILSLIVQTLAYIMNYFFADSPLCFKVLNSPLPYIISHTILGDNCFTFPTPFSEFIVQRWLGCSLLVPKFSEWFRARDILASVY